MSRHPSAVLLQALADDEVGSRGRDRLDRHVARCARCASLVAELRDITKQFSATVGSLDAAGTVALRRLAEAGPLRVSRPARPWLKAALIAGILAGSTAVAGVSAVWLRDRLAAPADDPVVEAAAARVSGLSILAPASGVRVELSGLDEGSRVEITLVDGDSVSIDVRSEGPVRYGEQAGILTAAADGRADISLSVPRAAWATITVGGTVRAVVTAGSLEITPANGGVVVTARESGIR